MTLWQGAVTLSRQKVTVGGERSQFAGPMVTVSDFFLWTVFHLFQPVGIAGRYPSTRSASSSQRSSAASFSARAFSMPLDMVANRFGSEV